MIFFLPLRRSPTSQRADLALHRRRRLRPSPRDHWRARTAADLSAGEQGLGAQRDPDRHRVEVLRLLHDAVCRGLQGVDKSLLEAAEVDGASALQRFRYITLPLLGR